MNLVEGVYISGYSVWATEVDIRHQGGIAVMWQREEEGKPEGMINYGPNMVSFLLIMGWKHWYVVGVYIPPNNQPEVLRV